jgi:hypothetical protein
VRLEVYPEKTSVHEFAICNGESEELDSDLQPDTRIADRWML